LEYIHQNPVRTGWVENAYDYLYNSARNYSGFGYNFSLKEKSYKVYA